VQISPETITGGNTVKESADIFLKILEGEGTEAWNAVVIINAATALRCIDKDKSMEECIGMAHDSLHSGKALKAFSRVL